jgi:hypothetical protein
VARDADRDAPIVIEEDEPAPAAVAAAVAVPDKPSEQAPRASFSLGLRHQEALRYMAWLERKVSSAAGYDVAACSG